MLTWVIVIFIYHMPNIMRLTLSHSPARSICFVLAFDVRKYASLWNIHEHFKCENQTYRNKNRTYLTNFHLNEQWAISRRPKKKATTTNSKSYNSYIYIGFQKDVHLYACFTHISTSHQTSSTEKIKTKKREKCLHDIEMILKFVIVPVEKIINQHN